MRPEGGPGKPAVFSDFLAGPALAMGAPGVAYWLCRRRDPLQRQPQQVRPAPQRPRRVTARRRAIGRRCLAAGAHGLTVHPRPDERHARPDDVRALAAADRGAFPDVELNVEGYPDRRYLDLVLDVRPHQATLVPDAPGQLTSDHGWNASAGGAHA